MCPSTTFSTVPTTPLPHGERFTSRRYLMADVGIGHYDECGHGHKGHAVGRCWRVTTKSLHCSAGNLPASKRRNAVLRADRPRYRRKVFGVTAHCECMPCRRAVEDAGPYVVLLLPVISFHSPLSYPDKRGLSLRSTFHFQLPALRFLLWTSKACPYARSSLLCSHAPSRVAGQSRLVPTLSTVNCPLATDH